MEFLFALFWWVWWLVIWAIKSILWVVGFALFGLWWCQGDLLYLPNQGDRNDATRGPSFNPPGAQSPAEHGLEFEDHHVQTSDGEKVHLWFLKQPKTSSASTIIFFHGNASNIGFRLLNARDMYRRLEANVVMVEYRGYGNSTGTPTEKGLMLDSEAVLQWLRARSDINKQSIFIFGRSLGGAVALSLSYHNQDWVKGIVVENTFLSIDDMVEVLAAKIAEPWSLKLGTYANAIRRTAQWILQLYMTSHWHSDQRTGKIKVPIMFISGLADELIPPTHSSRLFAMASPNNPLTRMFTVEGGGHNDTFQINTQKYYAAFLAFMKDVNGEVMRDPSSKTLNR